MGIRRNEIFLTMVFQRNQILLVSFDRNNIRKQVADLQARKLKEFDQATYIKCFMKHPDVITAQLCSHEDPYDFFQKPAVKKHAAMMNND